MMILGHPASSVVLGVGLHNPLSSPNYPCPSNRIAILGTKSLPRILTLPNMLSASILWGGNWEEADDLSLLESQPRFLKDPRQWNSYAGSQIFTYLKMNDFFLPSEREIEVLCYFTRGVARNIPGDVRRNSGFVGPHVAIGQSEGPPYQGRGGHNSY